MARLKTLPPRLGKAPQRSIPQVDANSWRSGKTSTQRGYGYRWQKERERFLMANPLCRYCQADGVTREATVVDHITPHRGDQSLFWDRNNWQPLCKPCHDGVKVREEAAAP